MQRIFKNFKRNHFSQLNLNMPSYLVTGANKGIGYAIVEQILEKVPSSFVFLGSRSTQNGENAVKKLVEANNTFEDRVQSIQLDVLDHASIDKAVQDIQKTFEQNPNLSPLIGLVNNAGGIQDDVKDTVALNFFGLHAVTKAVLPLLQTGGRVVMISSASGPSFVSKTKQNYKEFFTRKDIDEPEILKLAKETETYEKLSSLLNDVNASRMEGYGFSKALVNSYTMFLARTKPELMINACTPGFIMTDLTLAGFADGSEEKAKEMGMLTPIEGTKAPMKLLVDSLQGNGRYYGSDGLRSPIDRYRSPGDPEYVEE